MSLENLYYYKPIEKKVDPKIYKRDLIIYGGTSSSITAAIQAKKSGMSVIIAELGRKIGGMTASGLGATDLGAEAAVGGLSKEFYNKISEHYREEGQYKFEPKVASSIYHEWLQEYGVEVIYNQGLEEVVMENGEIKKLIMEDGNNYIGRFFIDATYEGDLLAKSNVSYFVGRESNSTYKEIYNGIQFNSQHHKFETWIDPYVIEGNKESGYLKGITETEMELLDYNGKGDSRIQSYNFRICLTKNMDNKIPVPMPSNYDPQRYMLLLRYIRAGFWDAMNLHTLLPNGKTDLNNFGGFSTDNIGMNYEWPDGSYKTREDIYQDHITYNMGMLYFLSNDKRVPTHVREEVSAWGLPMDEFVDTGHWPPQLYIREGRRMISDYVMTDHNCLGYQSVDDSIGLASYQMDSHHVRRIVIDGRVVNEGDLQVPVPPFSISYKSIRPRAEECTNLLVPVCLSSSHIAYGSIRMEPIFMLLGQSAAMAASLAMKNNTTVQDVDYAELREELLEVGQVLEWDNSIDDNPIERMKQTFGKETKRN